MRVLLTGAEGFIGSHLHAHLEDAGHKVVPFYGDVSEPSDWQHVGDYDAVVHLAALIGTAESMARPAAYVRSNVVGTAVMLEAMKDRASRVVLASSSAVYGDCYEKPEASELHPRSVYGMTKRDQEGLVGAFASESVVLRLFAVYGPQQNNPVGGIVGILARQLLETAECSITEDGFQRRDFVHIQDVCRAFELALEGEPGIYNIGTERGTQMVELGGMLSSLMGGHCVVTGKHRPGDVRHAIANTKKAREVLKWGPTITLEAGLADYVEGLR